MEQTVTALDGTLTREVIDSSDSTMTENEVVEHGGGETHPTAGNTAIDSACTITEPPSAST